MMRQTFFFVLASLLSSIPLIQAQGVSGFCCLCDGCYGVDSSKYGFELRSDHFNEQMTCVELDYKMTTQLSGDNGACSRETEKWRTCCCNSGNNPSCTSLQSQPTDPPKVNFPAGNFPYCDLCRNGQYPKNPFNVATIASVPGNPTCSDLYWMGRSNNLPASICVPIQNFLAESCGCTGGDPSPSPPNPSPPNPAPSPSFTRPKNPQRVVKDELKIGVVGRARGVSENA